MLECRRGHRIEVCKSAAGYYLGTGTANGEPYCRLTDYVPTKEEAESLEMYRQFGCIENEHCHGGNGCFLAV